MQRLITITSHPEASLPVNSWNDLWNHPHWLNRKLKNYIPPQFFPLFNLIRLAQNWNVQNIAFAKFVHAFNFQPMGFPDSSVGKESACNAGNPGSIPGLGRSPGEGKGYSLQYSWTSLVAQMVKNLPAMRETWVWSLGWEDLLKKRKATHYTFWPGEFHGLYRPWGHKELDMTERPSLSPLSPAVPSIWVLVNNHIPPKTNLIQCSEHISYSKKSQKEYHFINSCEGIL